MLPLQEGLGAVLDRHKELALPDHSASTHSDSSSEMPARTFEYPPTPTTAASSAFSHSSFDAPPLRVIVIGAGVGGLTLAQLLRSAPNVHVTCYERNASINDRLTGFRVMLSGSTLATLKGKLWNEVWSSLALSIGEQPEGGQKIEFYKGSGENLLTWDSDHMRDQYSVSRWGLRQGLLHRSEPFLRAGRAFERYEILPTGGTRVYFSDGSIDDCDILVGADGWRSRVKKQLIPSAGIKTTDVIVIYFKIPITPKSMDLLLCPSGSMVCFSPFLPLTPY